MKTMKKLLSILMVLTLVLSLGASAFAAAEPQKIVINGRQDLGSTYNAYKLFFATFDRTDGNGKEIYVYSINPNYIDAIAAGLKAVDDAGEKAVKVNGNTITKPELTKENAEELEGIVLEYLSGLNSDQTRAFADAVFGVVKSLAADASTKVTEADVKAGKATIFPVEGGYYLVSEVLADKEGRADNTAVSLVMLDTAGNPDAEVNVKEDVPESKKEVLDGNDSTEVIVEPGVTNEQWGESADHDIGDTVYFKLTGKLPGDMTGYETYKLVFHDTESEGLKFVRDSVKVYKNGNLVQSDCYRVVTEGLTDGCTFEVVFEDVLSKPGAGNNEVFTVIYGSQLTGDDVVIGGKGNENTMHMEYTNDAYNEGTGTGTTPPTTVVVFTYDLNTDKIDANQKPLEGAGFALLKKVAGEHEATAEWEDLYENKVSDGAYVKNGGDTYQVIKKIGPVEDGTSFDFKGIDDGDYVLVETTVPDGFNRAEDIYFTVVAEHNVTDGVTELKVQTKNEKGETVDRTDFTIVVEEGKLDTDVINQSGLELPETGGIGTTIFYVAGGILVAAAVILLVTRKRVSGAEK